MPKIKELQDESDITNAFPLMSQLRARIHADTFGAEVRRQQADGYHLIAAFDQDRVVGLAVSVAHTRCRADRISSSMTL